MPEILWVLISTGLFALIFAAAKFADGAVGTFQILFLRYIGSTAVVVVIARWSRPLRAYRSQTPGLHLIRAAFGCLAAASITWASAHMPLADASAIGMLYGVFAVALGVVLLGERIGRSQAVAVLISLAGATVLMMGKGAFQTGLVIVPALIALLSAMLMASEGYLIRVLSQRDSAVTMMLYIGMFGIGLMAVPAYYEWQPIGAGVYLMCFALGPLAVLAQYCTIRGYRSAPLSVVGPVDYSWLLFAIVIGWVSFGERPGGTVILGGGCIILGGIILCRRQKVPPTR
ncbi:DMT family transporter [Tateyamaria sp. SN3-11]|uniref:DMT family transporter n=1 Tax=Tateyamaria sp. SN3-11 TaxID=3092147 RepID=UPI0039ECAA0E